MYGYMGKLLDVDLTAGTVKDIPLNEEDAHAFIGGSALACKIMLDECGDRLKDIDPLGPDNMLILMTGPLTGTRVLNSGRFEMCAKSPLTGIWGESNCGGRMGPLLKFAGYDGIIIRGASEKPVYLYVSDTGVELKSAEALWGKGVYETQAALQKEYDDARLCVTAIGQAGENLVPIASVMSDKGRAAGRTGMGAVMGSKKLKAIIARGKQKIAVKDKEGLGTVLKEALELMNGEVSTDLFRSLGTAGYMETADAYGDSPVKYYGQGAFEKLEDISGNTMNDTVFKKSYGCYGCSIGCGRIIEVEGLGEIDGPEYETLIVFGSLCLNGDITSIYKANHICNDVGIDTISVGTSIAFAMYLNEKGTISQEDADGLDLSWGNTDTILSLIKKAAAREGFGGIIAQGARAMGKKYGQEDWAATVKGLELPMHDARAFSALAAGYATSNRGGTHVPDQLYQVDMGSPIEDYDIFSEDRFADEGKGELTAKVQNYFGIFDSSTTCVFTWIKPTHLATMFNCVLGTNYTKDTLQELGERLFNVKRIFNNVCGVTRADDNLPKVVLQKLEDGGTEGNSPDVEVQLKEYYAFRKWDWETGKPLREKLIDLELQKYAALIW